MTGEIIIYKYNEGNEVEIPELFSSNFMESGHSIQNGYQRIEAPRIGNPVMRGLVVPRIHDLRLKTWTAGTDPRIKSGDGHDDKEQRGPSPKTTQSP